MSFSVAQATPQVDYCVVIQSLAGVRINMVDGVYLDKLAWGSR